MPKLKIFGKNVPIKFKEGVRETMGAYGYFDPSKYVIVVDASLTGDILLETMLHEIFHSVEYRCSINQSVSSEVIEIINDVYAKAIVENFDITFKRP